MSKSEEESVEQVGELVSKVLNDIDPEKSGFLAKPTLALSGCRPSGQPSSCYHISPELKKKKCIIMNYFPLLWTRIEQGNSTINYKETRTM